MKKIILLILISMFYTLINAQNKYSGCNIEQLTKGANGMMWENDSLKFTFIPTDYFWKITIENKTRYKASIDWDEVMFIRNKKSSKIIFDNTIRLKMNDPLGETLIASKSEILKEIFPVDLWWETGPYPVFKKKSLRKEGNMNVRIIIPVSIENKKNDYEFSFLISPSE